MNPFDALGTFALGLVKNHELQKWFRMAAGLVVSAIATFLFVFGGGLWAGYVKGYSPTWDVILSFGTACTATSTVIGFYWKTSDVTKGIPFAFLTDQQDAEFKTRLGFDANKK